MNKYINADELKDKITAQFGTRYEMSCFDIVSIIMDFPSADVVEVVRCKDCIYNYGIMHNCEFSNDDIVCTMWETDGMHLDDFCSRGERKETE